MNFFKMPAILLALALLVSQNLFAQTEAESFRKQVGDVVYSLENVRNGLVPDDIDRMDIVAKDALSVELAAEVTERMLTGMELLKLIYRDPNLSQEEKIEYHEALGVKLADLLMIIVRQHGDDQLNPESDKRNPVVKFGAKTSLEMIRTFSDLLTFPRVAKMDDVPGADGHRVAKMRDRMLREYISQQAIIAFQDVMKDVAGGDPTVPATVKAYKGMRFALMVPDDKKQDPFDLGTAEKALRVRQNRIAAHTTVLAGIGVGYLTYFFVLPFDFFGMGMGFSYDLATARISDFLALTSAITVGLIRQATGSFKAIAPLKTLIQIIKDPANTALSQLKVPLMARLLRVQTKVERARETLRNRGASGMAAGGGRCEQMFAPSGAL
jgi:hypothetical protein